MLSCGREIWEGSVRSCYVIASEAGLSRIKFSETSGVNREQRWKTLRKGKERLLERRRGRLRVFSLQCASGVWLGGRAGCRPVTLLRISGIPVHRHELSGAYFSLFLALLEF